MRLTIPLTPPETRPGAAPLHRDADTGEARKALRASPPYRRPADARSPGRVFRGGRSRCRTGRGR